MEGYDRTGDARPKIWALGHVPPPVNGKTLLTATILEALEHAGPVTFHNWSPGNDRINFLARGSRVLRSLHCLSKLILDGRVRNRRLYIASNSSRGGLATTALMVGVARSLGYQVFLHHHVYDYTERRSRWMAMADRWMSDCGAHIMPCGKMVTEFRHTYQSKCDFVIVHPSVVQIDIGPPRAVPNTPFCLGMLSNLMMSKGVDIAIRTFRALYVSGSPVRLRLAGPIRDREAHDCINRVLSTYPGSVDFIGPVYAEEKVRFLQSIDCLVFPSRGESWGIVLHEAMARGTPVIAFDRGCAKTVIGDRAGSVVPRDGDYVATAGQQIQHWIDDPNAYAAASAAAIEQAEYLHEVGASQLHELVTQMHSSM